MKRGLKTSEGWIAVLVIVGQLVGAIAGNLPPQFAGLGAAFVAGVYALARGLAKAGGAEAFPALAASEPIDAHPANPLTPDEQAQLERLQRKATGSA